MKKKHTAQLRHRVANTRRISVSAFFNLRTRICLSVFCSVSMSAYADIITVTNGNDSGPGSLRQALADANGGDTINFDPALNGQTILLTTAELAIAKSVTISGPGANLLAVSRDQNAPGFRIFHVARNHTVIIRDHDYAWHRRHRRWHLERSRHTHREQLRDHWQFGNGFEVRRRRHFERRLLLRSWLRPCDAQRGEQHHQRQFCQCRLWRRYHESGPWFPRNFGRLEQHDHRQHCQRPGRWRRY